MTLRICGLGAVVLAGLIMGACSDESTSGGGGAGNTGNTGVGGSGNIGNTGGSGTGNTGGDGGAGNTGGGTQAECGDGVRNGNELCDGEDFGAPSCEDFGGYLQGFLVCSADCSAIDNTYCYTSNTTCGDGVAEGMFEPCDTTTTLTCEAMLFASGTVTCGDNCQVDVSGCVGDFCELNGWYGDGGCDPCELWGGTVDEDCAGCGADDNCVSYIWDGMTLGMSTCLYETGEEDPDCGTCGDDTKDPTERCDGEDLGSNPTRTCEDLGYTGGELACDEECHFDPSGCTSD